MKMKPTIEKLQFKFLLYGLYLLIRWTALRSDKFREKLLERDVTIVLESKDGAVSRSLRCRNGKVRSQKPRKGDVVSQITWINPKVGTRVMLKVAKGNPKALVKAVMNRELLPRKDAAGVKWFLDVVGMLARIYRPEKS